jgi:glycosyltransferase involved in cell wall biosynthesis
MRVLHISTSLRGGAGIAATRIHQALLSVGIESYLLSRDVSQSANGMVANSLGPLSAVLSKGTTVLCNASKRGSGTFVSPFSVETIQWDEVHDVKPDVLIIHNWFNMLKHPLDGGLASLKIPLVFVMHDERLYTGACHHAGSCRGFESVCRSCPQVRFWATGPVSSNTSRKRSNATRVQTLAIGPSQWITDRARMSSKLIDVDVIHIPNTIDTGIFTPSKRQASRRSFGICEESLVVAWQPGKGNDLFMQALSQAQSILSGQSLTLLHTGPTLKLPGNLNEIPVGRLASEAERADFWSAADVGLSLTEVDNFPNIVLESLSSGVPFVAPDVGGAGEAIRATEGGIVTARDGKLLGEALGKLLSDRHLRMDLSQSARVEAVSQFSFGSVGLRYLEALLRLLSM